MSDKYAYIIGCAILFVFWLFIFLRRKDLRQEMIVASLWGTPFGFLDFFLVPAYWHPKSLFGLIEKYGFGIESFIFLFLMAGITSVIYEFIWRKKPVKTNRNKRNHYWLLFLIPIAFIIMSVLFPTKAIYNLIIVSVIGSIITIHFRKDLQRQIFISAIIFSLLYFVVFVLVNLLFPNFVENFYNLDNISGITVFEVPLEELFVAFSAGAFWSTIYEYTKSYREKSIT